MIGRSELLFLTSLLVACSGNSDHETTRGLGAGGTKDASNDDADESHADDADLEVDGGEQPGASESDGGDTVTRDAAPDALDATPLFDAESGAEPHDATALDAAPDAGMIAGDGSVDSAEPDAGDDDEDSGPDPSQPFWIRVRVDNPHGHENPIQFVWGGAPVLPDDNGYLYAQTASDKLEVVLGESDETEVRTFFGIENGDELHFLYRHFREPQSLRPVVLPAPSPSGTTALRVESPAGSDAVSSQTASVRFYMVGASPYVAQALGQGPNGSFMLAYAFAASVEPATTVPFSAVTLGPWLSPRPIALVLSNAPDQAGSELYLHKGVHVFTPGPSGVANSFVVPPGFADFVEARVIDTSSEQDRSVTRLLSRCGPEADSIALDFADALPAPNAVPEVQGSMTKWTFPAPAAGQGGDVLIFDGVVMPATQTSITLPNSNDGSHQMLRIDVASAADYNQFKRRQLISFDLLQSSPWCQGTDRVRATQAEWLQQ